MLEINVPESKTFDVKVGTHQFKVRAPLVEEIEAAESSEAKVGPTVQLLESMGVPREVIGKMASDQMEDFCTQLMGLFRSEKK